MTGTESSGGSVSASSSSSGSAADGQTEGTQEDTSVVPARESGVDEGSLVAETIQQESVQSTDTIVEEEDCNVHNSISTATANSASSTASGVSGASDVVVDCTGPVGENLDLTFEEVMTHRLLSGRERRKGPVDKSKEKDKEKDKEKEKDKKEDKERETERPNSDEQGQELEQSSVSTTLPGSQSQSLPQTDSLAIAPHLSQAQSLPLPLPLPLALPFDFPTLEPKSALLPSQLHGATISKRKYTHPVQSSCSTYTDTNGTGDASWSWDLCTQVPSDTDQVRSHSVLALYLHCTFSILIILAAFNFVFNLLYCTVG